MTESATAAQSLAAAFAHLDGGRTAEAKRIARVLEKQHPGLPGLAYLLGLLALDEKAGAKAARHLARALKDSPDTPPLLLAAARAQAMQDRDSEAESLYRRLLEIAPATPAGRIELAMLLLKKGVSERDSARKEVAHALFVEATELYPDSALGQWLLAESCRISDRFEDAARAYRRVQVLDSEDHYGAALALAGLGLGPAPDHAPNAFVRDMFDQYAGTFDQSLVGRLHYRAPELIADAITRDLGPGPFTAFDAGCGTGLMGVALQGLVRCLDGADLSLAMIERARGRGLYRELLVGDFISVLTARPAAYDLIAAADVLVYIGDLAPVFTAVSAALKPGGGFAFTVERQDAGDWGLLPSGRYAHSRAYLDRIGNQAGMDILSLADVSTREDRGHAVPGLLCVMRIAS